MWQDEYTKKKHKNYWKVKMKEKLFYKYTYIIYNIQYITEIDKRQDRHIEC